MTPKYEDGEYMSLSWDYMEHPEFVRGHVTIEQAQAAFDQYFGAAEYTVTAVEHVYAHWGPCQLDGDTLTALYDHPAPGRGRFKVTKCEVAA